MKTGMEIILTLIILLWIGCFFGFHWAALGYLLAGVFNWIVLDDVVEEALMLNLEPKARQLSDNYPKTWFLTKMFVLLILWPKQYFHVC